MTTLHCDLLVVGAGPAGCAAAVAARAAEPGLSVLVVDAAHFPRAKPCGGAITGGGLRELALAGLALRVPHAVATHAVLRAAGTEQVVPLTRPAAVVDRAQFDADLVAQARAAGAVVLEDAALLALDAGVAVTAAGDVRFGALVAADGVAGASRRLLALPAGLRVPAREARQPDGGQRELLFDLDAVEAGYAWRFPCVAGGRAAENVGVYALAGAAGLEPALARFAEREGLAAAVPDRSAIRVHEPGAPVGEGRALLAGEALGVDPLAGEGIRYALWSGRIAARVAARALARGAAPDLRVYRARLAASRSGAVLALTSRLARRLHGGDPRWRRAASDPRVAAAFAARVSGEWPLAPVVGLLRRRAMARRRPGGR